MKGLLLRLSALDADAENAVRVISFFDALIAAKVSPQTLVRETARLAECPAGLIDTASGLSLHATPTITDRAPGGNASSASPSIPGTSPPNDAAPATAAPGSNGADSSTLGGGASGGAVSRGGISADAASVGGGSGRAVPGGGAFGGAVSGDGGSGGGVLISSTPGSGVSGKGVSHSGTLGGDASGCGVAGRGPAGVLADGGGGGVFREVSGTGYVWLGRDQPLPLDGILLERFAIAARLLLEAGPRRRDAGLVEVVLSEDAGELERCRALRLLHVEPGDRVHVLAVEDGTSADVWGASAHVVSLGRVHAVLASRLPERFPRGLRAGVGSSLPAIEAPTSWRRARTALRFSGLGSDVVHYDGLGALAVIAARTRNEDIADIADVTALDRLAAEPNGADTLAVLAAFCATGSARQAAVRVHRHHSTIAARLALAEERLGFSFSAPGGRRRLDLAILLRHLRDTPE